MKKTNYIKNVIEYINHFVNIKTSDSRRGLFLMLVLCILFSVRLKAGNNSIIEKKDPPVFYDEVPVHVIIEGYDNFFLNSLYTSKDLLYVNIEELFNTLKIPCIIGQKGDSIGGFIENEKQPYLINYRTKQIKVRDKTSTIRDGLIKEMGTVYLESSLFDKVFGIKMKFNYRSLSIQVKSNFELPVIKQQRIEKLRSNISKLKGDEKVDTVLGRKYHLFKFGTLDWLINTSQAWNELADNHVSAGISTEFLYGEANLSVNCYNPEKFDTRQLQYLWRWIDDDKKFIKQAEVGKILIPSISFLGAPFLGAVIRNSPATVRKAKGYYTINEYTDPNWTVELYINNVLVDYTKADASGSFLFKVPIVYGYTKLKLKFYGPMGEERTVERTMNVPYTIMPAREFEYNVSAGILQDNSSSRFGKAEMNFGVNRLLTIGGGLEYLSSIPNGAFIPYATMTLQPFSKLTINGEYAHGVKTRGLLDYYFWKDALLEFDYTRYVDGQLATSFYAPEERKARLSLPFMLKKISGYAKLEFDQLVYKSFTYYQTNLIVSAYYKQFSGNCSTQLNWIDNKTTYITSDIALSCRLRNGYTLRTSAQYNVNENRLITFGAAIEKSIPNGYITATYERNVYNNDNRISVGIKFDFPFARAAVSALRSNGNFIVYEGAQGSMAFGSGNNNIHATNNSATSKGGISFFPFLDINGNGIFDQGEPMVKLFNVQIMGASPIYNATDSIVRIPDLNAFANYHVEFSDNDLPNIGWRFKNKRYSVTIDPNQFKHIDVPIIVVGEVTGTTYLVHENKFKGIGRIMVTFTKKNSDKVVAKALSESDGYIDYIGLEPGEYVAQIDPLQLQNLGFTADPPQREFTIRRVKDGDIVSDLDFILHPETK
jgi:hypothetical protein